MVAALVCTLYPMLAVSIDGQTATNNPIALFQQAIHKIQSFDVTISVSDWNITISDYERGTNSHSPKIIVVETNRDAFAIGFGRRVERNWNGKPLETSVIDWKTAVSLHEPLADVLLSASGADYLTYINPHMGQEGCFLTDALNTNSVVISALDTSPTDSKMIGFQLEFPKQERFQNVFRIWLDSEHGYMLAKFERLVRGVPDVDHSLGLIDLMQVEQFIQIDKDIWVPAKAISYNVTSSGEMKLDENRSSYNSITSGELFSGKSLPEVNHEDDGWKQYLPPAELAKAAAFDKAVHTARNHSHKARWIIPGTMGASLLLLVLFAVRTRKRLNV